MFKLVKKKIKDRYWSGLYELQYGRETVKKLAFDHIETSPLKRINILDVGLGFGTDILNIKNMMDKHNQHLDINMYGVESYPPYIEQARENNINIYSVDIEKDKLPSTDNFFDIIIINQVLEHTKDWYWIFKEINRVLKDGAICIIGVPNMASWNERIRLLAGKQPNNMRLTGPHIRGITSNDFINFIETGQYFQQVDFKGSYFYGIFNVTLNNFVSKLFPTLCVSIFFSVKKIKHGDFTEILDKNFLETNFYRGKV